MAAILVIDDDPSICLLLQRFLKRGGHEVTVAPGSAEALTIAGGSGGIDLILTDLTLPGGLSGLDLVRHLRTLRPGCPVVVASGHGSRDVQRDCEQAGAARVLTKPFDLAKLQGLLRELLGTPPA